MIAGLALAQRPQALSLPKEPLRDNPTSGIAAERAAICEGRKDQK